MRKILLISLFSGVGLLTFSSMVRSNATGAPSFYTGAPNDNGTCNTSGCHTGHALNDTTKAKLTVRLLDNGTAVSSYVPGRKYTIEVKLTRASTSVMGFETSVQKGSTGDMLGTLSAGSSSAVQVNDGFATHTASGSSLPTKGVGTWTMEWTAPAKGTGIAEIYTAGNAANGDGTNAGDYIMTNKMSVPELVTGIDKVSASIQSIKVSPNPAHDMIRTQFSLKQAGVVSLEIVDLNSRIVQRLFYGNKAAGDHSFEAKLDQLPAGLYFVRLSLGNNSVYEKVMIN